MKYNAFFVRTVLAATSSTYAGEGRLIHALGYPPLLQTNPRVLQPLSLAHIQAVIVQHRNIFTGYLYSYTCLDPLDQPQTSSFLRLPSDQLLHTCST
jgi:hypothetical protein